MIPIAMLQNFHYTWTMFLYFLQQKHGIVSIAQYDHQNQKDKVLIRLGNILEDGSFAPIYIDFVLVIDTDQPMVYVTTDTFESYSRAYALLDDGNNPIELLELLIYKLSNFDVSIDQKPLHHPYYRANKQQ